MARKTPDDPLKITTNRNEKIFRKGQFASEISEKPVHKNLQNKQIHAQI